MPATCRSCNLLFHKSLLRTSWIKLLGDSVVEVLERPTHGEGISAANGFCRRHLYPFTRSSVHLPLGPRPHSRKTRLLKRYHQSVPFYLLFQDTPVEKRNSASFHVRPYPWLSSMLSNILASCVGYTICAVSASLHVASNQIIQFSQLPNAIETPSSTNISTSTNLQGKFSVECNGADYGNDLLVADCIDAIAYLPFNSRQWTFADRATPQATADTVLLPYRSMGGKCLLF